eukprot:m.28992 g.28992  ORF g.28992 m.28992 type:complete len:622 (-) comp9124_c1_seq2:26-1891(-)
MDFEIMIKNSRYMRARDSTELPTSNFGRSKRWRQMLAFPNIRDLAPLEHFLERAGGLTFHAIYSQPIGQKEFELSCESNSLWYALVKLRGEVVQFQQAETHAHRTTLLSTLQDRYFSPSAAVPLLPFFVKIDPEVLPLLASLPTESAHPTEGEEFGAAAEDEEAHSVVMPQRAGLVRHDALDRILPLIDRVLADEPFAAFRASPYYTRFLQWKMLEQRPVVDSQFRFFRVLGRGAFGEVWACQSKESGRMYACKRISLARAQHKGGIAAAVNERILLESIRSPFVVNIFYSYVMAEHLCLVLTHVPCGDLRYHLNKCTTFSLDRIQFYAAQLVLALEDLYRACVVYRDMKPENILLDRRGYLRLSDFGLAIRVPPNKVVVGRVGTPTYMAPEVRSGKYGPACDWFSLGATIAEMAQGESPFYTCTITGEVAVLTEPSFAADFDPTLLDLCKQLVQRDPHKRLGCAGHRTIRAAAVRGHPFFTGVDWDGLRSGAVPAPFVPSREEVYAEDQMAVDRFEEREKPLEKLSPRDAELLSYCQGAIPSTWQKEMLTTVFPTINPVDPPTPDLDPTYHPPPPSLLARLNPFRREVTPPVFSAERAALVYRVRQVLALSTEERGEETC